MSGRRKRTGSTERREWEPLHQVRVSDGFIAEVARTWGVSAGKVRMAVTCWVNDRYTVYRRPITMPEGLPAFVHLSIKRNDRKPIHDWRHLQQINNELVGRECEGVELYPAESRLVDEANQFHLFVSLDKSFRWPFGDQDRQVGGPDAAAEVGARQREWEAGLTTGLDVDLDAHIMDEIDPLGQEGRR